MEPLKQLWASTVDGIVYLILAIWEFFGGKK